MAYKPSMSELSRRERQIMEIVYKQGKATAQEVASGLPDEPGYSTVRKLMSILEEKGFLRHERMPDNRYLYYPTIPAEEARNSALANVMDTFFHGSASKAAIAMLKRGEADISEGEVESIIRLIESARRKGR